MKKIYYTIIIMAAANSLYGQGFLNKIKNKISSAVAQPAAGSAGVNTNAVSAGVSTSNIKYTNPSQFGTLIYSFSGKEMTAHSGSDGYGFNVWFASIRVENNKLQAQIADDTNIFLNYSGDAVSKTQGTANTKLETDKKNGAEKDGWSVDFSQLDQTNAVLKKGPHLSTGMIPGKPQQTLVFKGKVIGDFYTYATAHNADSSVIAVAGSSLDNGLNYKLVSSNGQTLALPKQPLALPYVSPDGKVSGALLMDATAGGYKFYATNGLVTTVGNFNNGLGWLRNTGNFFNVNITNVNTLEKNGTTFYKFNAPVDPKLLFISADDQRLCWGGYRGLYFSDGTIFENATSPHKVIIDSKEMIVFLDVDLASGRLYLCKHDL